MNFAGIEDKYAHEAEAKIVLLPVPYDGTSTWMKGADKGPEAFLEAAKNMELYDIETDSEVYKEGIFLAPSIREKRSPESMVAAVEKTVSNHLGKQKFVTVFGGEHSVSIGCIRAFKQHFSKLTVLQLDAHADLRPEYEGSANNHACALHEASKTTNLIQVGIRSMDAIEKEHMNYRKVYFAHDIWNTEDWMQRSIDQMGEEVYITIDLDAFDPSVLPATGTPEPGGLEWYPTLNYLKMVAQQRKIVGFDIMELCPGQASRASAFMAAKLYYKLLSYIASYNKRPFTF